jgi:hypothetical protein
MTASGVPPDRIDEQHVATISRRFPQVIVEASTAEARKPGGVGVEPALREDAPGSRESAQISHAHRAGVAQPLIPFRDPHPYLPRTSKQFIGGRHVFDSVC